MLGGENECGTTESAKASTTKKIVAEIPEKRVSTSEQTSKTPGDESGNKDLLNNLSSEKTLKNTAQNMSASAANEKYSPLLKWQESDNMPESVASNESEKAHSKVVVESVVKVVEKVDSKVNKSHKDMSEFTKNDTKAFSVSSEVVIKNNKSVRHAEVPSSKENRDSELNNKTRTKSDSRRKDESIGSKRAHNSSDSRESDEGEISSSSGECSTDDEHNKYVSRSVRDKYDSDDERYARDKRRSVEKDDKRARDSREDRREHKREHSDRDYDTYKERSTYDRRDSRDEYSSRNYRSSRDRRDSYSSRSRRHSRDAYSSQDEHSSRKRRRDEREERRRREELELKKRREERKKRHEEREKVDKKSKKVTEHSKEATSNKAASASEAPSVSKAASVTRTSSESRATSVTRTSPVPKKSTLTKTTTASEPSATKTSSISKTYDKDRREKPTVSSINKEKNTEDDNKTVTDPKAKITAKQSETVQMLTSRTGGAYIPPAKLRMMQAAITDKSSAAYQRIAWEALKKSLHGYINKVNVDNISIITREMLRENIVRGRGLLCRSVIQAQAASPTFTHVYAALVAIINSKFPNIGELLLKRLIVQFKRAFRRSDKVTCMSACRFIAHLVNQRVAHEILPLEILTLLIESPTDDSVEVAIAFLKECGMKINEMSSKGIGAIFEMLKNILHEGSLEKRVQYMIEVAFQIRKDGFKDYPSVMEELELVEEEDQFTHVMVLDSGTGEQYDTEDLLNVFKFDDNYEANENKYKELCHEILGSEESDTGSSSSGSDSSSEDSSDDDEDDDDDSKKKAMNIIDNTETNLIALRRTIYLTINSSLDYEECAHKLIKMQLKPGQEIELCHMFLDCCAEQRTYEKFYGLLSQRFCAINKIYVQPFENIFKETYQTTHRLDTNRLRNVSKFFAHLLYTNAISWDVLECISLNEDDTTSSNRIFIKILFQELAEFMGLSKLNSKLKEDDLKEAVSGIFPKNNPRHSRFSINFFTSIGLGGLTDELRRFLKNAPRSLPGINSELVNNKSAAVESSASTSSSSTSSSSSSESSSSDSSDSSSESSDYEVAKKKRRKEKKKNSSKNAKKKDKKQPKKKHLKEKYSKKKLQQKRKHKKNKSTDDDDSSSDNNSDSADTHNSKYKKKRNKHKKSGHSKSDSAKYKKRAK